MSHRSSEPGWNLSGEMLDPAGRRGVWFRTTPAIGLVFLGAPIERVEVCAGREGDDRYVDLKPGQVLGERTLYDLADALNTGEWCASLRNDHRQFDATVLDRAVVVRALDVCAERPIANAQDETVNAAVADCLEEIAAKLRSMNEKGTR